MCHHSFNNDDRRIHYHTKVDGSQRHQVAIDAECLHHTKGKEHTERDDTRHHQSGSPVTQEDNEYEDYDQSAFNQVAGDGTLYSIHQVGTIDKRFDNHSFRK